nr:MAG TPA: hypothetical protein [Caudoviricetes sp.]
MHRLTVGSWVLLGFVLEFMIALGFLWKNPDSTIPRSWKITTTLLVVIFSIILLRGAYEQHW